MKQKEIRFVKCNNCGALAYKLLDQFNSRSILYRCNHCKQLIEMPRGELGETISNYIQGGG